MIVRWNRSSVQCQGLILMVWMALLMIVGTAGLAGAQGETSDLKVFLEKNIGKSKGELGAIDKEVFVKKLDPEGTKREMAIFGIVRIAVPRDFFLAEFRDIKNFMHNKNVLKEPICSTFLLLSLIHISEPTRLWSGSRMPSSA